MSDLTNEQKTFRNAALEDAARAVEHLAKGAAHAAQSMRTKPCRDRRDEEDCERIAQSHDRSKGCFKQAADTIRALKA